MEYVILFVLICGQLFNIYVLYGKDKPCENNGVTCFTFAKKCKEKTNWTRLLNESMPLPDQIKNFEVMGNSIYFEWRRNEYKIETKTCSVWLVKGGMLNGDDCSTLIEHILREKLK